MKDQNAVEYAVVKHTVNILAVMCDSSPDVVIDLLTGHLWDKEEATCIKLCGVPIKYLMTCGGER